MHQSVRKSITTLLLGLILALPSLTLAGHQHEDLSDEINCELCSSGSPATAANELPQKMDCSNSQQESEKPAYLPFEVFHVNKYRRGRPLLR
jgi:hypothetical protein